MSDEARDAELVGGPLDGQRYPTNPTCAVCFPQLTNVGIYVDHEYVFDAESGTWKYKGAKNMGPSRLFSGWSEP